MVVKALSFLVKLGRDICWYSESLLMYDMKYELEEFDRFSAELLSISLDEER